MVWLGLILVCFALLGWLGLSKWIFFYLNDFGLAWGLLLGLFWFCLIWFSLVWFFLIWFCLVWFCLDWFCLAWFCLDCFLCLVWFCWLFGSIWFFFVCLVLFDLDLIGSVFLDLFWLVWFSSVYNQMPRCCDPSKSTQP